MVRLRRLLVFAVAITTIVMMSALPVVAKNSNNRRGGGNLKCSSLQLNELKLDAAPHKGQVIRNRDVAVRITDVRTKRGSDGDVVAFKWRQLRGDNIQYVIVKGGPAHKKYGGSWGGWLWSPVKGGNGTGNSHYGISNIRWCY